MYFVHAPFILPLVFSFSFLPPLTFRLVLLQASLFPCVITAVSLSLLLGIVIPLLGSLQLPSVYISLFHGEIDFN